MLSKLDFDIENVVNNLSINDTMMISDCMNDDKWLNVCW